LLNSKALTKIQSILLATIIVVAAISGGIVYFLLSEQNQSSKIIKIGLIGDIDTTQEKKGWQEAILAVEEINAEGGVLGKTLELIVEDDESKTPGGDPTKSTLALSRLITVYKVDFVVSMVAGGAALSCQDVSAEHKIVYVNVFAAIDALTQRVLDDYDRYKYFFSISPKGTEYIPNMIDSIVHLRDITGFNKIAFLCDYYPVWDEIKMELDNLPETHGFELVYSGQFGPGTIDFSSYFSAIESAGAEVLVTGLAAQEGIAFVKEWYDRQSPMIIWDLGPLSGDSDFWESTDCKCDHMTVSTLATVAVYPKTSKTLPSRNAYFNRWNEENMGLLVYDTIRFILYDAIKRAGTTEPDAVISALEETSIETANFRNFIFGSSHGPIVENPIMRFQWQDGIRVPIYPPEIMEEAGATYTFPDWSGPWDNLD